jgi:Uma2 family endonuclease
MELRSLTDDLTMLQDKIQEYLDGSVRLGWLLNSQAQQVEVYRVGQGREVRSLPTELSGEGGLPGFTLSVEPFAD